MHIGICHILSACNPFYSKKRNLKYAIEADVFSLNKMEIADVIIKSSKIFMVQYAEGAVDVLTPRRNYV